MRLFYDFSLLFLLCFKANTTQALKVEIVFVNTMSLGNKSFTSFWDVLVSAFIGLICQLVMVRQTGIVGILS